MNYDILFASGSCGGEMTSTKATKKLLLLSLFLGSFFLPMLVMVYVYLRISCVVANRHDDMVQINVNQVSATYLLHDLR
jgi:hypothetical protein